MDRRVAGVLALVLAVATVLFVPRLLNSGLAGTPSVAPMPTPPNVGSCVSMVRRPMTVVDCAQPHHGEITAIWAAENPTRVSQATDATCATHAQAYLGDVVGMHLEGWRLAVLTWDSRVVRAPRWQRAEDYYGWNACVIRAPDRRTYTGSVRDLADVTTRPAVFGSCQTTSFGYVSCIDPHDGERLAETSGTWVDEQQGLPAGDRTQTIETGLAGRCSAIAEAMTVTTDPTYGGRLRVTVWIEQLEQVPATDDETRFETDYLAFCELAAVDGELTGSVVGLGDTPLPLR